MDEDDTGAAWAAQILMEERRMTEQRFLEKVKKTADCWLWQGAINPHGYGNFHLHGRYVGAHRAAWLLLVGDIPDGAWILHKCDTPACVNPAHLFLGNAQSNVADMMSKGRHVPHEQRGDCNGNAKLSRADVLHIRASEEDSRTLATRFNVTRATIYDIWSKKRWSHV